MTAQVSAHSGPGQVIYPGQVNIELVGPLPQSHCFTPTPSTIINSTNLIRLVHISHSKYVHSLARWFAEHDNVDLVGSSALVPWLQPLSAIGYSTGGRK
jgi:hypothetical protein